MTVADSIVDEIRERGPVTVAAFMDLALYDPRFGYYARVAQRTGRAGDFFTSVDVGAVFGRLLAVQIAEMASLLDRGDGAPFDLIEAGAGNGRLAADVLHALHADHRSIFDRTRLHLIEASAAARREQPPTLGALADHLASSDDRLPATFEGVLFANELLDALPVHQVVMREHGLQEIYVEVRDGSLVTREEPPSTPALAAYLHDLSVDLEPGWRVEIGLAAVDWIRAAGRSLRRGFMILIDYGHPASELYSVTHASGTLTSYSRHRSAGPETASNEPPWLHRPGEQDITAHVDFTSVETAAASEGLQKLGLLDQTYFLLALSGLDQQTQELSLRDRLALKTLLMPGGLGSTMKVLILGKGVGSPALKGCSYRLRIT